MREDVLLVSGFIESPPDYRGGIWTLETDTLTRVYQGYGVFGLTWNQDRNVLFGGTRSAESPLVVVRWEGPSATGRLWTRVPIDYTAFIPSRAVHGIWAWKDLLFTVAAQGDPASVPCSNDEEWPNHFVSKVIISRVEQKAHRIVVGESVVWNPFACDHHHHLNDILVDDQFIYLSSFSHCDAAKRIVPRGTVTRFLRDLSIDRVLTDQLEAPHSLQIADGRLWVCSSRASSIQSISLTDEPGEALLRLEYKGINNFVRGLHVTPDYLYVGLSTSGGRAYPQLTEPGSGLLKVDRKSGITTRIEAASEYDNTYSLLSG